DLVESTFRYARVACRYTPCIRRCVGRSRLSACVQVLSPPFSPILLFFPLHGRCIQVLHFDPIGRAAGAVGGILALRDNAFKPELAGMDEDGRAVALDMLVEPDAGPSLGHDRCERGLADLKRITPQIVAVQFDQVEGVEKYALVSALVTDQIERRNAVVIAGDSFVVDNAGARAQASQCLDDQREAAG